MNTWPRASVVLEILWSDVSVVGLGLHDELNRWHGPSTFKKASRDSVHAVHHLAFSTEDHWKSQIRLIHQLHVPDQDPNGVRRTICPKPVDGVEFPDRCERDLFYWKTSRELDQVVDVPGVETVLTRPEVVLLPHRLEFYRRAH